MPISLKLDTHLAKGEFFYSLPAISYSSLPQSLTRLPHLALSKIITPVTEGLSGTRLPISRPGKNGDIGPYVIGNGYLLSVHSFSNVCSSSGAPPSSITAFTELGGGYTYKNKYNSGPIGYSADNTLPAVPTGVTATKSGKSTTVKWNAVEGATGYFVVYSSPFYASELGSDVQLLRTQIVGAGKTQDTQPVAASIVTVVARRGGAVSDTGKTGQFVPRSV